MKALVYTGPKQIELRDEPDPQALEDEVLVRVEAVGICGSDMHAYFGHDERRPPPLILGHEACGRVLDGRFQDRRVVINPLISCGHCDDCLGGRANLCRSRQIISMPPRQGAFAELLKIPETNILPVPDDLDPAHAALAEPIATALHAITVAERVLWRPLGEASCLVMGGGSVGLAAALVLASRGACGVTVADTNAGRRETVSRAGPFTVVDPTEEGAFEPNAFGLVVDAVGGRATRAAASAAVAPGGVIVHIGLMDNAGGLAVRKFTLQEVTFVGSYTYTMVDFRATVDAIQAGVLGDLGWIERRRLDAGATAFDDLAHGRSAAPKIVLVP